MTINRNTAKEAREFYKTYAYDGAVAVDTGDKRFYAHDNCILSSIEAYVGTAPAGSALNITVNKNGSSAATLSIAAGGTQSLQTARVSFDQGDYVTVDITQVGSSTAGSDLRINFKFRKV